MSPAIYPDDILRYVYGRGPALPTEPKHTMICATDGCQLAARIKVDGVGLCPACYDRRQRERAGK